MSTSLYPRAEPGRLRAEDVELLRFQFLQQPPVNRAHQFGGDHGPAVFGGQGFSREPVKISGAAGDAAGERGITVGVFGPQNFVFA